MTPNGTPKDHTRGTTEDLIMYGIVHTSFRDNLRVPLGIPLEVSGLVIIIAIHIYVRNLGSTENVLPQPTSLCMTSLVIKPHSGTSDDPQPPQRRLLVSESSSVCSLSS